MLRIVPIAALRVITFAYFCSRHSTCRPTTRQLDGGISGGGDASLALPDCLQRANQTGVDSLSASHLSKSTRLARPRSLRRGLAMSSHNSTVRAGNVQTFCGRCHQRLPADFPIDGTRIATGRSKRLATSLSPSRPRSRRPCAGTRSSSKGRCATQRVVNLQGICPGSGPCCWFPAGSGPAGSLLWPRCGTLPYRKATARSSARSFPPLGCSPEVCMAVRAPLPTESPAVFRGDIPRALEVGCTWDHVHVHP